jgi:hypothetical protein
MVRIPQDCPSVQIEFALMPYTRPCLAYALCGPYNKESQPHTTFSI